MSNEQSDKKNKEPNDEEEEGEEEIPFAKQVTVVKEDEDEIDAELHNPMHRTTTQHLNTLLKMESMPKWEAISNAGNIHEEMDEEDLES